MNIEEIISNQRLFFNNGSTKDINYRISILKRLEKLIIKYSSKFIEAFKQDFNKSEFDTISTELYQSLDECRYMIKNIRKFSKRKKVKDTLITFPSKSYIIQEPYGVCLIISPWNYPLQLSLVPLIGALAAGNCIILKPSEYSFEVSKLLKKMIDELNQPNLISVLILDEHESEALLNFKFDYIFFTGSKKVGQIIYQKANKYLTPLTLELGGKSPCLVLEDADIELAAKRITWAKFLNAGQTCVAPDYVLINKKISQTFKNKVLEYIKKFYYDDNGNISNDFPYIINEKHKNRLINLIDKNKIITKGKINNLLIEPLVLENITFEDEIMKEEIFGPIMPIIDFEDENYIINKIKQLDKPLAFYLFTKNKIKAKQILHNISFGGGCLNDTIMHLTNRNLPFGGIGESGFGSYHGKKTFNTFSHEKSILIKGSKELKLKYPPITKKKVYFIKKLAKIK